MSNKILHDSTSNFTTGLLLVFIVLKLCKVINWSWWWVLSPLWIPIAVLGLVALILILLAAKEEIKIKKYKKKIPNKVG